MDIYNEIELKKQNLSIESIKEQKEFIKKCVAEFNKGDTSIRISFTFDLLKFVIDELEGYEFTVTPSRDFFLSQTGVIYITLNKGINLY